MERKKVNEIYYNTCALCGSNLDPGEKCACLQERALREQERRRREKELYIQERGGQIKWRLELRSAS